MSSNNTALAEITPLILAGDGYQLTIAPEAEERKLALLAESAGVLIVSSNDESGDAQVVTRRLAGMRIEVEKSRKLVKEPINRIGKQIDAAAADFVAELTAEENRIKRLVGDHAMEVARIAAEKARQEREAFEAARRAREEAERAEAAELAARESKASIAEVLAAKQAAANAERERQETLAARMDASAEVAGTKVAEGVRFAWDFEVLDEDKVFMNLRPACEITVRRTPVLDWLKALETQGEDPEALAKACGIRAFKKPVVSSR